MSSLPADFILEVSRRGSWTVVAASYRGPQHIGDGTPRQDAFAVFEDSRGAICVATADGLGSKDHSELGASFAVEQGAKFLQAELDNKPARDWFFSKLQADFVAEARRNGVSPESCATTVQYLRVTPDGYVDYMRLGDGAAVMFDTEFRWMGGADKSRMGVSDLSMRGAEHNVQWRRPDTDPVEVFMLFTDGLEQVFKRNNEPHVDYLRGMVDALRKSDPTDVPLLMHRLMSLKEGDLNDDRTLVVALRSADAPARPYPSKPVAFEPKSQVPAKPAKGVVDRWRDRIATAAVKVESKAARTHPKPIKAAQEDDQSVGLLDRPEVMYGVVALVFLASVIALTFVFFVWVLPGLNGTPEAPVQPMPTAVEDATPAETVTPADTPTEPVAETPLETHSVAEEPAADAPAEDQAEEPEVAPEASDQSVPELRPGWIDTSNGPASQTQP